MTDTFSWVGSRFADRALRPSYDLVETSGDLAHTVGFERGVVRVDGRPPAPVDQRVAAP